MKAAIDTGPLVSGHKVRGVGVYTGELIKAMRGRVEAADFQSSDLTRYDLIHFPAFNPFFRSFKLVPGVKVVVTIHDLIPLVYPAHYPPGLKGWTRFNLQKHLIKKVDAIITDTETSKKDICRFLSVQPDKVHVVYLAPRKIFKRVINTSLLYSIEVKYKLPKKFVLYVGDVNYNKNIPNLIRACEIAKLPLVICGKQAVEVEELGQGLDILKGPRDYVRYLLGKPHPELAHFKGLLKEFKENKNVIRLGFVPDEDLAAIYNLATVYCQPSFYEGFGLPVLEALACGCPVVASKTQALVEIAEGAATFVDARSPKKIAEGFKHLVKNPKLPRAYSWEKTAEETLAVYKRAYESK